MRTVAPIGTHRNTQDRRPLQPSSQPSWVTNCIRAWI